MKDKLIKLKEYLDKSSRIVAICHYNPDGDSLGSALGLKNFLHNIGREIEVISPNNFPENLDFLDEDKKVILHCNQAKKAEELIAQADLIFCMDFQSYSRAEKLAPFIAASKADKILIDHHLDPVEEEFSLMFSCNNLSSTSELLYTVLLGLDPDAINDKVARCIYAGIITDTGSFSYSCAHASLFEVVANLIKTGIDAVAIHRNIYDTYSLSRLRLLGFCLGTRLKVFPEHKAAYMYLTKEELEQFEYQAGDTEGIVNYALSMKGIKLAAFFTERENRIRISFRSIDPVDVSSFAKQYFHGGGHRNAAGGASFENMSDTIAFFESLLPEFMENK